MINAFCAVRYLVPRSRPEVLVMSSEDKQGFPAKSVAVIGAGVSGLSAAYKLKLHGLDVTVFEADGRSGGKLKTVSKNGFIWDEGANTMTESEAGVSFLLDNLGIRDKQQFPLSQKKRYVAKNGKPILLPSNPIAFITSNILSTRSKLQVIFEPFLWKNNNLKGPHAEESVGDFFQRHFGKEVVDYLIDPFIAGTSGGDPESLSMRHVFPDLRNLEKRFGSLISGVIQSQFPAKEVSGNVKSSSNKKHKRASFSFIGGMQALTNTLCNELGEDELRLQSKVLELSYNSSENSQIDKWSISYELDGKKLLSDKSFDALIMTAPLSDVKQMKITNKQSIFPLDFIPKVNYLPMSVIITTVKEENVRRPLKGFGVLVPSKEQQNGLKTLGTLFSSMMFPDRSPKGYHLYTTFVGGSRNPELAKGSSDELKGIVASDLRQLLGAVEPEFLSHYYWNKAFPLYGHNYDSVLEAIEKIEKGLPGFFYAGNQRGGISVGKAISSGCQAADLVISYLNSCSDTKETN